MRSLGEIHNTQKKVFNQITDWLKLTFNTFLAIAPVDTAETIACEVRFFFSDVIFSTLACGTADNLPKYLSINDVYQSSKDLLTKF